MLFVEPKIFCSQNSIFFKDEDLTYLGMSEKNHVHHKFFINLFFISSNSVAVMIP
jgi:hypothetical protein